MSREAHVQFCERVRGKLPRPTHSPLPGTQSYATANDVNQYPSVGGIPHSYDGNGNLTGDGVRQYGYDTENHMVTANLLLGATLWRYRYDPMHRQAQKEVGPLLKTRFIYAGWQRIADYDGVTGTLQNRYVYGTGLDEPLIQVAAGGALTYLHHDRLGSIIALTDGAGAVTNRYKYSPWGESSSMTGTSFGYTGQRFDSETGNWYFKNRYQSSRLGRFLQTDPLGYVDDLNLYTYVLNDPLNLFDSLGTQEGSGTACDPVKALADCLKDCLNKLKKKVDNPLDIDLISTEAGIASTIPIPKQALGMPILGKDASRFKDVGSVVGEEIGRAVGKATGIQRFSKPVHAPTFRVPNAMTSNPAVLASRVMSIVGYLLMAFGLGHLYAEFKKCADDCNEKAKCCK